MSLLLLLNAPEGTLRKTQRGVGKLNPLPATAWKRQKQRIGAACLDSLSLNEL
jgi:hypothetical protein